MAKATYSRHHFALPEGHVFIDKPGACTVTLVGAASMSQDELDRYGELLAQAINDEK